MAQWRGGFSVDSDEEAGFDEDGDNGSGGSGFGGAASRDGLIVLVDCRDPMLRLNSNGQPLLRLGLKCAKSVLKQKALASDRDLVGVVLFGCGKSTSAEMPHVFVLQTLDQAGADRIKQLARLVKMDPAALTGEIGASSSKVSLSDAIWSCQSQFSSCPLRLGFRRIFLFTNDDSPHEGDAHLRAQLRTKIRDLQQTEIELVLFPQLPTASAGGNAFDARRFYYDNLLPDEDRIGDGADRLEDLLQSVAGKAAARRAQVRLGLRLGPGCCLPVAVYNLTRRCAVPTAVRLHRATNEPVKRTTRRFLAETAEVLMPTDLKKAVNIPGKKVLFEQEEVKQMRHLSETGLSLLAFYPLAALKRHHHLGPASFLYPDEASAQGSTCLFTSLLRACQDKGRFALCAFTPRSNAATSLVALVPQAEVRDRDTGAQTVPPGFHLVRLPFADDFRKLSLGDDEDAGGGAADAATDGEGRHGATDEQIEAAKALTQRLAKANWSPEDHSNPALQTYYAQLEAIALDKVKPRDVADTTVLGEKALARAEKAVDNFLQSCGLRKRSEGGGSIGGAAKRTKAAAPVDLDDVETQARSGAISKLTVPALKEIVAKLKLKPTGQRKQDLLDAVNKHFGV